MYKVSQLRLSNTNANFKQYIFYMSLKSTE